MVFCAVLGVLMEKFAYKPLRSKNSSKITLLITAMGLSLLLQNTVRLEAVAGSNFRSFPSDSIINVKTYELFGASISNVSLITIGTSLILVVLLILLVNYTKVGKAMRACSYDTDAAALMGINVNTIISITFAIGSALAAAAGLLYAVSYPRIDPAMGVYPGLKAFVAAVLGGIGILPGAMLGGFLIGIIETIAKIYASSYANAITFSILIVILLFRPTGLLGKKGNEKV
jgi:branched-chain amino acid transport system permease protein